MEHFALAAIPAPLSWRQPPQTWEATAGQLTIVAGSNTDWFNDPAGDHSKDDAPAALFTPPDAAFLLSARVMVDFAATYDAGALLVAAGEDVWAKLCFEYSPQMQPMIVSVVTRGVSDDCNSVPLENPQVYLRIARQATVLAFHYSLDGVLWQLVRYFSLGETPHLQAGFSAQSPQGDHCRVQFTEIRYTPESIADFRDGS